MNKKLRVPVVIAAVAVTAITAAASCAREVCREGEPSCSAGGAGGTTTSATHGSTATNGSTVASTTNGEGGFV